MSAHPSAASPIVLRGSATWPWYLQYLRDPIGGQGIPGPRGSLQSQLRQGLTRMKEPKHKLQRQLMMPTVLKTSVDRYLPAMERIIAAELDPWRPGAIIAN